MSDSTLSIVNIYVRKNLTTKENWRPRRTDCALGQILLITLGDGTLDNALIKDESLCPEQR